MVKLAALAVALALLAPAATGVEFAKEDLESDDSLWKLYELWGARYKVARDPGEKLRRFAIFKETARRVYASHLQVAGDMPLRLNIFADLSLDEIRRDLNCRMTAVDDGGKKRNNVTAPVKRCRGDGTLPLPESFDWRTKSCNGKRCLPAVQHQGTCGACWAFAATAALESHYAIRRKGQVLLSQQELVDCDTKSGGCKGGRADNALDYVTENGLGLSETYPYMERDGTCRANDTTPIYLAMWGFERVPAYNEFQLLQAVTYWPVVVSIAAPSSKAFVDYTGGLYRGPCGSANNHEMLLVGYGYNHYILMNSYGETWGEKGYMLLARNSDNHNNAKGTCGILMYGAIYPDITSL